MGDRLRETCTICGRRLPEPVDPDPGDTFHFPKSGYLCAECYERENSSSEPDDLTRCDTCHRDREAYEVESVPICDGKTATVCRECLSHLADYVTRIGML